MCGRGAHDLPEGVTACRPCWDLDEADRAARRAADQAWLSAAEARLRAQTRASWYAADKAAARAARLEAWERRS